MSKQQAIPKYIIEIVLTLVLFVALGVFWNFVIKESIVLSDQGLSTLGIALSTSIGVLTAIVVSFVLIVWQTSRRDRTDSFLRWRDTLNQLFEYYDANLEKYPEIREDVFRLTWEASAVSSIEPMKREKCKELVNAVYNKLTEYTEYSQNIQNPSSDQVEKAKIGKYMSDYLVMLTHANFDHNIAHNLYPGLLHLRGLIYRLLGVLGVSVVLVAISATSTKMGISDIFNAPLAIVLIMWIVYLLIHLGISIKRFTSLEDEFLRLETEAK